MKQRYSIDQVCEDVADSLRQGNDHSATTIRCAINDALDAADKSGFAVNFEYNQLRAVANVKKLIGGMAVVGDLYSAE